MSSFQLALVAQGINDANATRYFTAAGLVMLIYDHLLTFADEYHFIWKSKGFSFPKYAFIFNRYFVPCMQLVIANEMCGFNSTKYSDSGCRWLLSVTSMLSLVSVAIANLLILLRVLQLWRENRTMRLVISGAYIVSIIVTVALMILLCVRLWNSTGWSAIVHMCVVMQKTPVFGVLWGVPMFYEIIVLTMVAYNSIASPRSAQVRLSKILRRDGITYFLAVMVLRLFNMILATVARPELTFLGVYFVWCGVTTVLNRSLLRMRKFEVLQPVWIQTSELPRTRSPFGSPSDFELTMVNEDVGIVVETELQRTSSDIDKTWGSNHSRPSDLW